ncbi:MAG: hypothetical protein DME09_09125 [Candidatus Rokuibacteriota bacterium]|nr:MAG: hypothetical protein DME09_09125 [Candidatus Rokubacteria bacterium]
MMKRMQRWWVTGLVALAAGSIFSFDQQASWAASDDTATQDTQMQGTPAKDDDSAKPESAASTSEETPTAGEKDQSGEKDQ